MTATATTATIAAELSTTPRELRKFLRSLDQGVGKGSRYALPATKREIEKMRKNFASWVEAREAAKKVESVDEVESDNEDDAPESLDELEGPTDEEIAELTD